MRTLIAIWLPTTFVIVCAALALYCTVLFIIPAMLGVADARARYKDFCTLKYTIPRVSEVHVFLRKYRRSACQRWACIAAWPRAREFYQQMGYKWYHLLPEGTFSRNSPYLKMKFYKQLLLGT